jgi:hypothetical protein
MLSSIARLNLKVLADPLRDPLQKWGGEPLNLDEDIKPKDIKGPKARDKSGRDAPLDPDAMFNELDNGLTGIVGPFKKQPFIPLPNTKFRSVVHAGRPGRGKAIYKFLEGLGFTGVYKSVTGYFGGVRHETDGRITIVDYNNFNGVTSITTQLK